MQSHPEVRSDYGSLLLDGPPLIDVRAPIEFEKGAVPNAINLPILDDEERRLVGLCYKQEGQSSAIALGHQLVSGANREAKIAAWCRILELAPETGIFCWRGGMRSGIAQQWLRESGYHVPRVAGGFKALRQFLMQATERLSETSRLILIGGRTGVGKTDFIDPLANAVDLEGLANHRGSAFGNRSIPQPAQIDFEHALACRWLQVEKANVPFTVMEDEGRFIGRCRLPACVGDRFARSELAILEAHLPDRIERINRDYVAGLLQEINHSHDSNSESTNAHEALDVVHDPFEKFGDTLLNSLSRIRKRLGLKRYAETKALMESALAMHRSSGQTSGHDAWIEALLRNYYDPMYDYQIKLRDEFVTHTGGVEETSAYLERRAAETT